MRIGESHRGLMHNCAIVVIFLVFGVQPAQTQGSVAGATLALDRSAYCIGESWKLSLINAPAFAAIRLAGVIDDKPWSLPDWGMTDQDGRYSTS